MSKFYVWIDNPADQIETSQEFNAEAQRIRGFVKGETISSKVNNTALRQANLIAVAMMEALGVSDDFDVASSVLDLANEIRSKLTIDLNLMNGEGENSIVQRAPVGLENSATELNAIALGHRCIASNVRAIALGNKVNCLGNSTFGMGQVITIDGSGSMGLGHHLTIHANYAIALCDNIEIGPKAHSSLVAGKKNKDLSKGDTAIFAASANFISGLSNTIAENAPSYANIMSGRYNVDNGSHNMIISGENNTIEGMSEAIVSGRYAKSNPNAAILIGNGEVGQLSNSFIAFKNGSIWSGQGLQDVTNNACWFGKYNKYNFSGLTPIFGIGNGTSDTDRQTPFFIDSTGTVHTTNLLASQLSINDTITAYPRLDIGKDNKWVSSAFGALIGVGLSTGSSEKILACGNYNRIERTAVFNIGCGTSNSDRRSALLFTNDGTGFLYTKLIITNEQTDERGPVRVKEFNEAKRYKHELDVSLSLPDGTGSSPGRIILYSSLSVINTLTIESRESKLRNALLGAIYIDRSGHYDYNSFIIRSADFRESDGALRITIDTSNGSLTETISINSDTILDI